MKADMKATMDWEQLMMDALDGTIAERDREALNVYFDTHPQERALFERMQRVDGMMRADLPVAAPVGLKPQVMRATTHTSIAQPPLRAPQIAFLILIGSVLVVVAGIVALMLYSLVSPALPGGEVYAIIAFARGVMEFMSSLVGVVTTVLRSVFSQPVAWTVLAGACAIVALWLRVMARVFMPSLRFASV